MAWRSYGKGAAPRTRRAAVMTWLESPRNQRSAGGRWRGLFSGWHLKCSKAAYLENKLGKYRRKIAKFQHVIHFRRRRSVSPRKKIEKKFRVAPWPAPPAADADLRAALASRPDEPRRRIEGPESPSVLERHAMPTGSGERWRRGRFVGSCPSSPRSRCGGSNRAWSVAPSWGGRAIRSGLGERRGGTATTLQPMGRAVMVGRIFGGMSLTGAFRLPWALTPVDRRWPKPRFGAGKERSGPWAKDPDRDIPNYGRAMNA